MFYLRTQGMYISRFHQCAAKGGSSWLLPIDTICNGPLTVSKILALVSSELASLGRTSGICMRSPWLRSRLGGGQENGWS